MVYILNTHTRTLDTLVRKHPYKQRIFRYYAHGSSLHQVIIGKEFCLEVIM